MPKREKLHCTIKAALIAKLLLPASELSDGNIAEQDDRVSLLRSMHLQADRSRVSVLPLPSLLSLQMPFSGSGERRSPELRKVDDMCVGDKLQDC